MSSAALTPAPTAGAPADMPRSLTQIVLANAIRRPGARVGLAWLGIVAFLAVFAPLLANSYPIVIKMDGRWSSPLLRNLTAADVVLFAGTAAALTLLFVRSVPVPLRLLILLGVILVSTALAVWAIRPPKLRVYEEYREAEAAGRVQYVLRAPIPYSPSDYLRDRFHADQPPAPHPWAPNSKHWLGTDRNGGDILSRMIHACRIAMSVGFISTGIALIVGAIIGGLMGYFAGWVDLLGMRLVEIFSSMPTFYLLLACVAFFGRDLYIMMVILGLVGWVGIARFVRAEFLKLRHQDFVHAATAAGLPLHRILFRHILPNAMAPVLVSISFSIAAAILAETGLTFIGLGLVDEPSWGQLLNQAVSPGGGFHWWLAVFPGMAIFLTVFAYNMIGEALRDALDPRIMKRE